MSMNVLSINGLQMRCLDQGQLPDWLGPAVQGAAKHGLNNRVCRCNSGRHAPGCAFGELFDPPRLPKSPVHRGREDPARPVVLIPEYPSPTKVEPGQTIGLNLVLVGPAVHHARVLVDALSEQTARYGLRGVGQPVRMLIDCPEHAEIDERQLDSADLLGTFAVASSIWPRVKVVLSGPLAIKRQGQHSPRPSFGNLFANALEVVKTLFSLYGQPLDVDSKALRQLADGVPTLRQRFNDLEQLVTSDGEVRPFKGTIGQATFRDVPLALLPWLVWGGRLHVGDMRVAGAGGWRVLLD